MRKVVVIDCDGVLADFENSFCQNFGNSGRFWVNLEQRYPQKSGEIKRFVENPDTYKDLELLEVGKKIAQFFDYSGYKIHINTSRPFEAKHITFNWLKEHEIPFCKLVIGRKLQHIEETMPDFVIDDFLLVVEHTANDLNIPSFLVDHPWNRKEELPGNIHRISNYEEFLAIVNKLY